MANQYTELKGKHEKEFNEFTKDCVFFAFSDKQFEDGMKKLGLTLEDTDKIYKLGAGGYILRTHSVARKELFERFDAEEKQAIAEDADGTGYVRQMFEYELNNHEYGYTREVDQTLDALGYTIEEINADEKLLHGFQIARQAIIDWDNANN